MGKLLLCEVGLMFCAVMLTRSAAEPLYFHQNEPFSWESARKHCQDCFKDLATVTFNASFIISKNLSSNYWIGLRKYFSPPGNSSNDTSYDAGNFTSNNTTSPGAAWTRWANGDPLSFQNWYPGWPKFKVPVPQITCCSCSCTCPAATTTGTLASSAATYSPTSSDGYDPTAGEMANVSGSFGTEQTSSKLGLALPTVSSAFGNFKTEPPLPFPSQCDKSEKPFPQYPDPNKDYIEDSCVAMLSSGSWVEKNCLDPLPFVCYEDRFYGEVTVSNVTANTANLRWMPVLRGIDHYRLNVSNSTANVLDEVIPGEENVMFHLEGLTAGTRYNVTVFAVKCGRDMDDPQKRCFNTIPNKVKNLTVVANTPSSITLNWVPPESVDFFRIECTSAAEAKLTNYELKNSTAFNKLTPGTLYMFNVWSAVNDSRQSEAVNTSAYTQPDKVEDVTATNRTETSLAIIWKKPNGNFSTYDVTALFNDNLTYVCSGLSKSQTSCVIDGLPSGTLITFTVTLVGYDGQTGERGKVSDYTAPKAVTALFLIPDATWINVNWTYDLQNYSKFFVETWSSEGDSYLKLVSNEKTCNFTGLKPAVNYTVCVQSFIEVNSTRLCSSSYTKPLPPTDPMVISVNDNSIKVQWKAPAGIKNGIYEVELTSTFWNWTFTDNRTIVTTYTFSGLKSGTYYTFNVRTLAGNLGSDPVTLTKMTDAKLVKYSFAMMCSSETPLHCGNYTTQKEIFDQLQTQLGHLLDNNVYWNFASRTSENLSP